MKNIALCCLSVFAGALAAQGAVIAEFTFNDRSTPVTQAKLEASSSVAAGAQVSSIGFSSTYAPDFSGVSALPAESNNDVYSFGDLGSTYGTDRYVMFLDKSHNPSLGSTAFNRTSDTSVAVQPLHFTVSADLGYEVTVTGINFRTRGVVGSALYGSFQEAGDTWTSETLLSAANTTALSDITLALSSPSVIAAGDSQDFTIYLNHSDGGRIRLDNIAINGTSVIPEPSSAALLILATLSICMARRPRR